jgi:hypothetical protein
MEPQPSAQAQPANQFSHQGGNAQQGNHHQNRHVSNNNGRNRSGYNGHNGHHNGTQAHKDGPNSGYNQGHNNNYNNRGNNNFFNNKRGSGKFNGANRPDGFVNGNQGQGPAMTMGLQNMHHLSGAPVYGNLVPSQSMPPMQLNPGAAPYMMSPPNQVNHLPVPGPYNPMPPNVPQFPVVGGYGHSPQMARQLPARPAHGLPPPTNQGVPLPVTPRYETAALDSYYGVDKFADSKTNSASKTVPNTPNVLLPPYQFGSTLSPNMMSAVNHRGPHYHSPNRMQPPHTAMPSFGTPDCAPSDINTNVKSSTVGSVASIRPNNIDTPLANTQNQHDRNLYAVAALSNHERMAIKGPIEVLHLAAELKRTLHENERLLALDNYAEAAMKEEEHETMMLRYHEQIVKYLIRHVTAVLPEDASDEQKKEYEEGKNLQMQKATNSMHHAFQHQLAGSKFRRDAELHRAAVVQSEGEMRKVDTELNKETWKLIQKALDGGEDGIESDKSGLETLASVKHGRGSQKVNRLKNGRDGDNRKMSSASHTSKNGNGKAKNATLFEGSKPYLNASNRGHSSDGEPKGDGASNNKGQDRKWKMNHKKSASVTTEACKTTNTSKIEPKTEPEIEPKTDPKVEPKIEPTPAEAAKMGNGKVGTDTANTPANSVQNDNSNSSQPDNVKVSKPESTNSLQNEMSSGKKDNPASHNRNNKNKKQKHKKTVSPSTNASKTDAVPRTASPKLDITKLERPRTAAPMAEMKVEDAGGKKVIDPDSYARQV